MSARSEDIKRWSQWNRTKSGADLQAVLDGLQPIITSQVNRWSASLPRQLLDTKAKVLAVEAIKTYNPNIGVALATHVINRLQKLSRVVYTHTQAARLPEYKVTGMSTFNTAQNQLQSDLGREPTHGELADHLGWSTNRTKEFQKAYSRRELLASGEFNPAEFSIVDDNNPIIDYIYFDMAPDKQQLFENITGYGGKPVLSNRALMRKFNLTQGQLSYQKRQLTTLFKKAIQ